MMRTYRDRLAGACSARNLEVFYMDGKQARSNRAEAREEYAVWMSRRAGDACGLSFDDWAADHGYRMRAGWYWWSCCPGCMPDGEAMGPYASATRAAEDALDVSSAADLDDLEREDRNA